MSTIRQADFVIRLATFRNELNFIMVSHSAAAQAIAERQELRQAHPYEYSPIHFVTSIRARIISGNTEAKPALATDEHA